jgi:hypothetical protein
MRLIKLAFCGPARLSTALLMWQIHPKARRCVKSDASSMGLVHRFQGESTC